MNRSRVLIVTGRPPWPPWRGDQLRTRQWVEALQSTCEVTVLSPTSAESPDYATWDHVHHVTFSTTSWPSRLLRGLFALVRRLPAQCGVYHYPDLGLQIQHLAPQHDVVVVLLARLALSTDKLGSKPWVADLVDALSLSFSRRARVDRLPFRPLLALETQLLDRAETKMISRATQVVLVSQRDADYLSQRHPRLAFQPEVIPVATSIRASETVGDIQEPKRTRTLAFTGNLGYFVNRDALSWWLRSVWPSLRKQIPDIRLLVAGDRPPRSLRRAVAASGGELVARPEDLRGLLASCTLAIAPLRCGAGMPLKILDAWSVGVPVVASRWGAAGVEGQDGYDLRIADSVEAWVSIVVQLLEDEKQRQRLSVGGLTSLEHRFSQETVFSNLRGLINRLHPGPRTT